MKIDEFEKRFNAIIENPDTGIADAGAFLDDVRADYTGAETAVQKIEELEAKIKELQESNIKLYLAQTSTAPEEDDIDEDDGEAFIDNVFSELLKESEE